MTLQLNGEILTINDIKMFLNKEDTVEVTQEALERVKKSRQTVEHIIENKETIYGITTGFGLFSDVRIDKGEYNQLQVNLIRSHACGVGKPFSEEVALVMMVLRLNTLLKGHSGTTVALLEQLVYYINHRIVPVIPQQGSLGASGDLAPLSHLALALIGEGNVFFKGEEVDSWYVLNQLNRNPIQLQAKEGLHSSMARKR